MRQLSQKTISSQNFCNQKKINPSIFVFCYLKYSIERKRIEILKLGFHELQRAIKIMRISGGSYINT